MIATYRTRSATRSGATRRWVLSALVPLALALVAFATTAIAQPAPSPAAPPAPAAGLAPSPATGPEPSPDAERASAPGSSPAATPGKTLQEMWAEKNRSVPSVAPEATPPPAQPHAAPRPTPSPAVAAAGPIRLTGTFNWVSERGRPMHPLTATLTPAGAGRWDAVWNFTWTNQPQTFRGYVQGNLQDGAISGTGNMTGGRTFAFTGTARGGAWTFSTTETTGREVVATGTGTAQVGW